MEITVNVIIEQAERVFIGKEEQACTRKDPLCLLGILQVKDNNKIKKSFFKVRESGIKYTRERTRKLITLRFLVKNVMLFTNVIYSLSNIIIKKNIYTYLVLQPCEMQIDTTISPSPST